MHSKYQTLLAAPFMLALVLSVAAEEHDAAFRLIAHRGGVVDGKHIEHSLTGLQEAIDRGYWMVEVDVRETKDGRPLVHHDKDFRRYYNDSRLVAESTWNEIQQLRLAPGNNRPLLLREFAELCRRKIRLMLEVKGPSHDVEYYESIENILRQNGLLEEAYMIGIPEAKDFFKGKLCTSLQRHDLRKAIAEGEDVAKLYFLFEGASELDEKTIRIAREAGIPIIAAINRHQYRDDDAMRRARSDVARMKRLGIRSFQIDSVYDRWFLE